ncbi:DNA polymerase III subunit gamma/tau [Anoxybacillus ayderensis]|uniref:DNA polymerase III subunit gamma/tau n=1 Tax=Anoxybacillus ayderensis TaxID=265546 RepID=UPI000A26B37C|nr:DNA polymerase III subunit gamma/tau [Anoxybacillus ayderensis]OSX53207.1 DNA polymerase III subunit gamma/tau [Anoxybacillus ayderensis]
MSYKALYRVFRPQSFKDVVGQEHVTKTLQNALLQQKISHAYLFSGPRGTGKTSIAKIFAKAVNCEHRPTAEPCNECPTCLGITNGSISDVLEIDAASNNGVDEIRDIREKVKFAPTSAPYKVYIIDEVHMLSIGAFNALLKTLEEPPKHVIFILATTEPHKIPLTIVSRCQRFDFRRIELRSIVSRLKTVVAEEGIDVEEEALFAIARAADGGMRDALSLLDQAISFSEDRVLLEDVLAVTGAVSQRKIADLIYAIYEKKTVEALRLFQHLMEQGKDPNRLVEDLIYYYRDMLLYKAAPQLEDVTHRVLVDERFRELSDVIPTSLIYEAIDLLSKSQQDMRLTNHPRVHMEVAIVKLCYEEERVIKTSISPALEEKVRQLEEQLAKLKETGVKLSPAETSEPVKKTGKSIRTDYKIPIGRIHEVLRQATHQHLSLIKGNWPHVLETLKKQNKVSHAALLQESEPVAASSIAFVLKFKYEIHCKMVADNSNYVKDNLEQVLFELTGKKLDTIPVPESEWLQIREQFIRQQTSGNEQHEQEDPFISEAKKWFGENLIEIKE